MRTMRTKLDQAKEAKRFDYTHATRRLFLGAVEIYCGAVEHILSDLRAAEIGSRGFRAFRDYLSVYTQSDSFQGLAKEAREVISSLAGVRYCLLLQNGSVTVRDYQAEDDYTVAVEDIFENFRRDATRRYRLEIRKWDGMNHIENQIQNRVALLCPDVFGALESFCAARAEYLNETVARFDREIQFYIAYLTYAEKFRRSGLLFCLPEVSASKQIRGRDAFDVALAGRLLSERKEVVLNDFYLIGSERIFVVSGPNQGGKTTFARMIGQLHYLASLGCPIPGSEAHLFRSDRIFTHFEREEHITNLRGKLQDDLMRIHEILSEATPNSLIIMNEMFSSTALKDAVYLSKVVMQRISDLDLLGVWVTFLDELSSLNEKTVSVVSTVNPENPAIRTYKLERKPADGLAYALAIAQKYHVTYDCLRERIKE